MIMNKYNYSEFSDEVSKLKIDIFISSSSFEDRCFIIADLVKDLQPKKNVFFFNGNEDELIISNSEKLCAERSNSNRIELNSNNPVDNYVKIDEFLSEISRSFNNPNVLIDITTFTHETLLVLVKLVQLKNPLFGDVYIAYVGAKEYSTNSLDNEEKWLSKGIDQIRTVLGYSGFTNPTHKNHLIILFGFESERTKRIIEEYEYENITLGFGGNFIMENHLKINYERHAKLLKEYPNARKFTFSLTDPVDAKNDILNYLSAQELKNLNTVIAPLNNKISTVGAALAAMSNERIQLAYAKPLIYNTEGYSRPNNDIYLCKLAFD